MKSRAPGSARSSRRSAPRSGRQSAAAMHATTATTAWRTRMASRFGTEACVRTQHSQPRGRSARAAALRALPNAPPGSSANFPPPRNAVPPTSRGSANLARRPARLTTTPSAAATTRPMRTHAQLRQPAYRSRARAPARLHDLAVQRPERKDPSMPPRSSTIVPSSSLSRSDASMPSAGFCA